MDERGVDVVDTRSTLPEHFVVVHGRRAYRAATVQPMNVDHPMIRAKILTVSDGVVHGSREDRSGAALERHLGERGFEVVDRTVVADGIENVREALLSMSLDFSGVIVTTGGTGFGPRDLTPEGTRAAIDREAPGLAEAMRQVNPLGRLSRAICGTVGETLILNTPGSTAGCVETFDAVADVVPHAVRLLVDNQDPHPHDETASDPARG